VWWSRSVERSSTHGSLLSREETVSELEGLKMDAARIEAAKARCEAAMEVVKVAGGALVVLNCYAERLAEGRCEYPCQARALCAALAALDKEATA
jgi:hypothetical protein